jgi:predicted HTH transcriptional regulator
VEGRLQGERARPAPTAPKAATPAKKNNGQRLARRSPDDIKRALASIVALVKKTPNMRAEAIRTALKMDRKELPRVIAEGLSTKALSKKGEKRATTYRAV